MQGLKSQFGVFLVQLGFSVGTKRENIRIATDLPGEILIDIFSRLPAKSVGKCRCLSKPWRNSLSSPEFIKSHLARQKTRRQQEENLILITPSHTIHSVETIKVGNNINAISRKLDLPGHWCEVLGSCDGLLLLFNNFGEMFLANPITLVQVKLPSSPLVLDKRGSNVTYGFGYDSVRDDYKVVALSYYDNHWMSEPRCTDTYVCSVKTGVWKRLGFSPYTTHAYLHIPTGVFVNGAIHWLDDKSREPGKGFVITAFNLGNEAFIEIPPPIGVDVEVFTPDRLVVLGGCLCLTGGGSNVEWTDLWIMKDYGVGESWTKHNVYGYGFLDLFKPLCLIGDREEEVVSVAQGQHLFVYNLEEGTSRDLVVDGFPWDLEDEGTFVESLVSPAALCIITGSL